MSTDDMAHQPSSPEQKCNDKQKLIFAGMLLFFATVPMPALLSVLFRNAGLGNISILSAMAGLSIFYFIHPKALGIQKVSAADIGYALLFALFLQISASLITEVWRPVLIFLNIPFAETQQISPMLKQCDAEQKLLLLFCACVTTPVLEEILFRRMLYTALLKGGKTFAFAAATLFFAAVHFFLLGFPGLLILGAGFQLIYLKKQNLSAAILTHIAVNVFAAAALFMQ